MQYEVEMKFAVGDVAALEDRLAVLGATISGAESETDTYFAHPARDFTKTDEALRLRQKKTGCFITYKGPKIDATTKTRQEIDLPLAAESGLKAWRGLLEALGFTVAGQVKKLRRKARVGWQGRSVEISLDDVDGLGAFVELELIANENDIVAARDRLASLAKALGLPLDSGERRSYLELLLAKKRS